MQLETGFQKLVLVSNATEGWNRLNIEAFDFGVLLQHSALVTSLSLKYFKQRSAIDSLEIFENVFVTLSDAVQSEEGYRLC